MTAALTPEQLLDSVAIRLDGLRAAEADVTIDWHVIDADVAIRARLSNGALTQQPVPAQGEPDLSVRSTKAQLVELLAGGQLDDVELDGDASALRTLLNLVDSPDPQFPIVTP